MDDKHTIILENRNALSVSGVARVMSFDESCIELELDDATLVVEGEELHILDFDSAAHKISAEGRVGALCYYDGSPKKARGLFGRRRG